MDDFYNEMKEVLNDLPAKTANDIMRSEDLRSSKSYSYFPNIFEEALAPINPRRWPAFTARSAIGSDMPEIGDKILTLLDNLCVTKEYLETSQSDVQWRARLWTVAEDTTLINMQSELGGDAGSFVADITSNKIAEKYMDKMYGTAVNINTQEELNFKIFKQVAREQGVDIETVRGTGWAREFVPEYMQGDICERPERNARPNPWGSNGGLEDDGIMIGPHSNLESPLNDNGALNLPCESSYDSSSYSDETISNTDNNINLEIFFYH
jgi:hypothetical protein